jgi:hypothetical protein
LTLLVEQRLETVGHFYLLDPLPDESRCDSPAAEITKTIVDERRQRGHFMRTAHARPASAVALGPSPAVDKARPQRRHLARLTISSSSAKLDTVQACRNASMQPAKKRETRPIQFDRFSGNGIALKNPTEERSTPALAFLEELQGIFVPPL